MPRQFVIGDIHGDWQGFILVLNAMVKDGLDWTKDDKIIFLGDLVDGFPHSRQVVEFVKGMQEGYPENVIVLKGNHEDLMLTGIHKPQYDEEFKLWWYQGGKETYASYEVPALPEGVYHGSAYLRQTDTLKDHLAWMEALPTMHETDDFYFVHAGFYPGPPEDTSDFDRMWIREEFLKSKHDWGKVVVHGHTPVIMPEQWDNRINVNTRSRGAGYVTGAELFTDRDVQFYCSNMYE